MFNSLKSLYHNLRGKPRKVRREISVGKVELTIFAENAKFKMWLEGRVDSVDEYYSIHTAEELYNDFLIRAKKRGFMRISMDHYVNVYRVDSIQCNWQNKVVEIEVET